jgi:dolichol kinase
MREKEKKHKGVTRLLRRGTPNDERTLLHLGIGTAAWAFVGLGGIPSETVAIAMFALAWMCISLYPKDYKALLYFASVSALLFALPPGLSVFPILALCVGDAAAGYIGNGNGTKSFRGMVACFTFTTASIFLAVTGVVWWHALAFGLVAAASERYSGDYDNFFVPASVFLTGWLLMGWLI